MSFIFVMLYGGMVVARIQYENGYYIGEVIGPENSPVEEGKGRFVWSNGDTYEGDFLGGTRTGKGMFRWVNGDTYEGEFLNGARTGKGAIRWANGERYEGEFLDGHMEGIGTHYSDDGKTIYDGEWIESCPINRIMDG
jgi:hypothetical protein